MPTKLLLRYSHTNIHMHTYTHIYTNIHIHTHMGGVITLLSTVMAGELISKYKED